MKGKIAVICSSRSQYDQFVRHWVQHDDQENFVPITNERDVRGQLFISVIRIGDYWTLRRHEDLYQIILARIECNHRGNEVERVAPAQPPQFAGQFKGKDIYVTDDVKEVIDHLQYELETLRAQLRLRG